MIFDTATITEDGFRILTEAAAGEKIIWGTCMCSQDESGTLPVAKGNAVSAYKSTSTDIAYISCSMDNTQPGCAAGMANYFLLYAKKESDVGESLVIKASVGTHAPTEFPEYDPNNPEGTSLRGIVDFNIQLSQGTLSTIDMTVAAYALASDVQALSERVLTTHVIDNETAGETQTVYGKKVFMDGINIGSTLYNESTFFVTPNGGYDGAVKAIVITEDSNDEIIGISSLSLYHDGDNQTVIISCEDDGRYSEIAMRGGSVVISADNYVIADKLKSKSLYIVPGGNGLELSDDEESYFKLNSLGMTVWTDTTLYDLTMSGNIEPQYTNSFSIGSSAKRFDNVWTRDLNSKSITVVDVLSVSETGITASKALNANKGIPSLCSSSNTTLSIGAMAMVWLRFFDFGIVSGIPHKKAGDEITYSELNSSRIDLRLCETGDYDPLFKSPSESRALTLEQSMRLKLLCDFQGTVADGNYIAFVMRVA